MPSVSAAMIAIDARVPPMSGLPVAMVTVPSALTATLAPESPAPLNQKPDADPRPWFGPSGAR